MNTITNKKCFRHPEREATARLNIPCAPGGGLDVCAECKDPANLKEVFEAYRATHAKEIKIFSGGAGHGN